MPTLVTVLLALLCGPLMAQPARAILLNVQKGDLPNDATVPVALTTDFPEVPDGVSLKATFGDGALGQYNPRLKDWTGFVAVEFFAHNASDAPLDMYFALRDKDTVDYNTRADIPFRLQPGPNSVALDLTRLRRIADPRPMDLSSIRQWYIARAAQGPEAVVYFGDIVLEGPATPTTAPATPVPAEGAPAAGSGGARIVIEGKIRIELDEVTFQRLLAGATITTSPAQPAAVAPAPAISVAPQGKRMLLVDPAAGIPPFEGVAGVTFEVSDDYAAELGGKSIKVTYTGPESALSMGYWGLGAPPGSNWTGYDTLRFEAYNPTNNILSLYLAVRDQQPGYENRADLPFKLTPGLNRVELPISTIVTNAGKQLDKAHITQWFIPCDQAAVVYFANIRLESP